MSSGHIKIHIFSISSRLGFQRAKNFSKRILVRQLANATLQRLLPFFISCLWSPASTSLYIETSYHFCFTSLSNTFSNLLVSISSIDNHIRRSERWHATILWYWVCLLSLLLWSLPLSLVLCKISALLILLAQVWTLAYYHCSVPNFHHNGLSLIFIM